MFRQTVSVVLVLVVLVGNLSLKKPRELRCCDDGGVRVKSDC